MIAELRLAVDLARVAGREIMRHYGDTSSETKLGGSPVTAADHAANRLIVGGIRDDFPSDAILAEESADSAARLGNERIWIVDPLDGTKEFLAGNGEFAVMIGLAVQGEPVLGVVYLPDSDRLYRATRGGGTYLEVRGNPAARLARTDSPIPPRMIASRSHLDASIDQIRSELGIVEAVRCGSVGVKCARIAEGIADLYVHPVSYLCEWDTCAPEIIAREAGARVTDCLGGSLRYNKADANQPHGIVVRAPGLDGVAATIERLYGGASAVRSDRAF